MRYDLAPLYRATVGFDRLANLLDSVSRGDEQVSYPPYNIEKLGDNAYRISIAVAGFSNGDIAIESKENALTIKGAKPETDSSKREFLHRGIAERAFELRFQLAEYVEVAGASLENGLLHVELKRELPESKKARQIPISGGAKTLEDQSVVN